MRKNGFTLIELLAVIVILAIIALIATPIILGIINDAREKANERSVELYASAVKNGIAAYQLTGLNAPKSFSDLTIEYDGDVKCTTEELYEDGSFYLEGCKVNGSEKEYSYGTKQEKKVYLNEVCDPVSVAKPGEYTLGDKYTCTVDPNKPAYTFYVLTTPENGSINLIMDSNIRTGGEAVKEATPTVEQRGLVAWITQTDYERNDIGGKAWDDELDNNEFGPITAMEYLQEATKDWTNTNTQIISTFTDDVGATHSMGKTYVVNARMPYYSEVSNVSSTTVYLIDYLQGDYDTEIPIVGRNGVSYLFGYWMLSSNASSPGGAWYVTWSGGKSTNHLIYEGETMYGVRPVINLSI